MNKTKKIYETPTCENISPYIENLLGLGLYASEAPDDPNTNEPLVGAKRGQYLFDDSEEIIE